jgi:hypothetical protein
MRNFNPLDMEVMFARDDVTPECMEYVWRMFRDRNRVKVDMKQEYFFLLRAACKVDCGSGIIFLLKRSFLNDMYSAEMGFKLEAAVKNLTYFHHDPLPYLKKFLRGVTFERNHHEDNCQEMWRSICKTGRFRDAEYMVRRKLIAQFGEETAVRRLFKRSLQSMLHDVSVRLIEEHLTGPHRRAWFASLLARYKRMHAQRGNIVPEYNDMEDMINRFEVLL